MTQLRRSLAGAGLLCLLLATGPASAAAQDEVVIESIPVEIANFEISSMVPADWDAAGNGLFTRGTPPDDVALIAIQSAAATLEQLWPILLTQLGVPDVPEVTGERSTDGYDWTLRRFDVGPGGVDITVELATAERDGRTALVIFQAAPDEFGILRDGVLLPALDAFAPLEPEVTPHPSTFDYVIEDVRFAGGADGVELAGTLTRPSGEGRYPVVVLMSGSGAQDRDEAVKPLTVLKPFALIADALTSAGVAVLRYDDRGVGGSTGDYDSSTIGELASDGAAAIDYVASRDDIDPQRIGILGHSEGGLYAAMLAREDSRISFIVLMAPGVVDGVDLLAAQNEASLRVAGESEAEIEFALSFLREALPLVRDGDFDAADAVARDYLGSLWDRQSPEDQAVLGERDAFIDRTRQRQDALWDLAWFQTVLGYDASLDWQHVSTPVLGLFGGKDVQVVADLNEPVLREALEAAGNEDFEIVVFPDANHFFQSADTGAVTEYPRLEPAFTPDFLPAIVDWVTRQVAAAG